MLYIYNVTIYLSRGTRSYAIARSTKHGWEALAYSQDFSKICWSVKICYVVLWLGRSRTGYPPVLV